MLSILQSMGQSLYPYLNDIATAIIACGLVVFGADINRFLRRKLTHHHFIVRTAVFILLNAFGYGLLIVKVSPYLASEMRQLPSEWLSTVVIGWFIVVGVWAQKHRQV
ncbi:DUF3392 domain-containing protein [Vibrio sp. SCSIO 43136]|uniref:DUF3392 domain-containing protein n=1 Tax=Vibrio sp. SCSIO 43136 TaxID=2819101 RepID=UPI00207585BD|nr:DUF3392 domain-containing protein [Vibrio sp. SCSIO 43136]USD64136.1 DUF3392 domain-containing protein [Vibrio sp. SCSIO 43136]